MFAIVKKSNISVMKIFSNNNILHNNFNISAISALKQISLYMKWYVVIGVEGMLRCFNKKRLLT